MAYPLITEKQTFFYQNSAGSWVPASGYLLFVYTAGTTTKVTTHKETDESSQNTNPIVLNSRGEVPNGLYVAGGSQYKLVLAPSTDTDPPAAPVWTRDELSPVNDTTITVTEWQASGYTPTYVSATSFTVTGDRTSTFQVGRRVKTTNTGGTIYGTISASAYTSLTTVTVVNDSGSLDSGLSSVDVGILSTTNTGVPLLADTIPIRRGSATGSKQWRVEVDGLTASTTRVSTIPDYDHRLGNIPAGVIMDYAGSSVPTGWLECDGSAVSRTTYSALFTAISTTWGIGDGSSTFNLPDFRGRVRIGKGTGTATASGVNADVDTTNDTLTVASNNDKWITGMLVTFTLSSGTVTGLTSGNPYYVIRNNATTVKLASSLANAQNGTAIDMTAKSSPVWTITHTLTARALADQGGEQSHAMTSTELLSHQHTDSFTNPGGGGIGYDGNGGGADVNFTNAFGGNAAMNIMQPYATTMAIISY